MWLITIIIFSILGGICCAKLNNYDLIDDFGKGSITTGFITILIILVLAGIGVCNREVTKEYELIEYEIEGLENKINRDNVTEGTFVLGFAYAKSEAEEEIKYYYFRITDYGKKLETLKIDNYSNTYIKETNEQKPCLIAHYQQTRNVGFFKWLFGEDIYDTKLAETLVVPENTIKIEYNVEI